MADFDALHSRVNDRSAVALAFDLMSLDGEDFRYEPFSERKAVLRKVLRRSRRGIQYVEHTEGDGGEMFKAICKLGLEGIVSKKLDSPYKSGPSKAWLKIKNPNAPAATRKPSMVDSEIGASRLVLRLGHSIYQFAETATKLSIKDTFDGVRTFTRYGMKLV